MNSVTGVCSHRNAERGRNSWLTFQEECVNQGRLQGGSDTRSDLSGWQKFPRKEKEPQRRIY